MSDQHLSRRTTQFWKAFTPLCASLLLSLQTSAQHPNQPQGFSPERSYQMGLGGIDQVDLYSGRLSLTLPVGPFTLYYNNNVWRYADVVENNQARIEALPDRMTTAGLGWHLGWGELYHPDHWYNTTGDEQWMYIGQDGKPHLFYDRMHYDDAPDGDTSIHFSRDNSYLRLRQVSTWVYDIEFPDGTVRRFANAGSLSSQPFRLVSAWNRFGSASDPDMTISYNADDTLRTVTDRYGRNHYVHLLKETDLIDGYAVSWMIRVVHRIDAEGFGGQRNIYDLEYRNILVSVSCKDTASATPTRIRVPHLVEVQNQAEGTAYTMLDGASPAYYNVCEGAMDDVPGALRRINLPTGGALRWTFQRFEFPPGGTNSVFNTAAGVASREMVAADGTVVGTWTYRTRNVSPAEELVSSGGKTPADPEMLLDVVALPEGDCSRHYFDAIYYQLPSLQKGWELGLPFTYSQSSGGKYLSTEIYSSNDGTGLCAGTKLRSTYVRYRKDVTPGCVYDPVTAPTCPRATAFYDSNRTVEASRVVFHDDGDRVVDSESSVFDGLGNFREQLTTGTFWAPSLSSERRHVRSEFNRVSGTYGQAGYTPPSASTPWILNLLSSVQETEDDAVGESTRRTELSMSPTTGAIECLRQLRTGATRSASDLLTTFSYNSLGLVTDIKHYGSDLQSLSLTGSGCGTVPLTNPLYWTTQTYQYGALKSTYPRLPSGTLGLFPTFDVDLDPSTGQVTATRDPSGYEITFTHDSLGRIVEITPEDGAVTSVTYTNALGTSPAKVTTIMRSAQGFETLGVSELVSDSFGRQLKERVAEPGNIWRERETVVNARGWLQSISQWGDTSLKTQFLELDAFGRPRRIRPADGSSHDVTITYLGNRKSITTFQVQKSLTGAESATTREQEWDRYGRLRRVREGAAAGGALSPTFYSYDVNHHLTRTLQGTSPQQQMRQTDYDNRGFKIRERHPEKGSTGNGWVYFYGYDPQGKPNRVLDGPNDLGMSYDYAGRMTELYDRTRSNRPVSTFTYDSAPGFGIGKLWKAARFNYIDLPWLAGAEETVKVEQIFSYQGLGGEISQKDTTFTWPDGQDNFRQSYLLADAGQVKSYSFPRCTNSGCSASGAGTAPTVTFNYSLGKLTGIPGWINSISYHGDGSWSQINHSNGVVDYRERHPQLLAKTQRLYSTGPAQPRPYYESGLMSYDGAGNIKSIGADGFAYDAVNRLTAASFPNWGLAQAYEYDLFGNLTQRSTTANGFTTAEVFPTNSLTNRLSSGATYDAAGNVLSQQVPGGSVSLFSYDTQNNLVSQAWMRYLYDAFNERAGSFTSAPQRSLRFYLRDLGNRLVSEVTNHLGTYARVQDTLFAGSRLVARIKDNGAHVRYHVDHLGTPRVLTANDGSIVRESFLLPYGEELPFPDSFDSRKLSGHERDASTGTDYMHARHYFEKVARFLSVDPFRGVPSQPQSLNRYAYVQGNPIRFSDPTGLQAHEEFITVWGIDPDRPSGGGAAPTPRSPNGRGGTTPTPVPWGNPGGRTDAGDVGIGPGDDAGSGGDAGPGDGDSGAGTPPGDGTGVVVPTLEQGLLAANNLLNVLWYLKALDDLGIAQANFSASLTSLQAALKSSLEYGAWLQKTTGLRLTGTRIATEAVQTLGKSATTLASAEAGLAINRINLIAGFVSFALNTEIDRSRTNSTLDIEWNLRNMKGPDDLSTLGSNLGNGMTNAEAAEYYAEMRRRSGGN